jgi:hypothetical protein
MIQIELDAFIYETSDLVAAERLIEMAPTYFKDDQTRQDATATIFEHFFLGGGTCRTVELRSGDKLYKPDGLRIAELQTLYKSYDIGFRSFQCLLKEGKNGIGVGNCNPWDQGAKDYLLTCLNPNVRVFLLLP